MTIENPYPESLSFVHDAVRTDQCVNDAARKAFDEGVAALAAALLTNEAIEAAGRVLRDGEPAAEPYTYARAALSAALQTTGA